LMAINEHLNSFNIYLSVFNSSLKSVNNFPV